MSAAPLKNKNILVTGAAIRLGNAITKALATAGANIIIHYRNSATEADDLAKLVESTGCQAWCVQSNLDTPEGAESMFANAVNIAGKVSGLVNNAAVFARGSLLDTPLDAFGNFWQINTLVPVALTRALFLHLRSVASDNEARPLGRVVNLLDQRITRPAAHNLAYGISKQALAEFTRGAALELAPDITVNGVAPGAVLPPPKGSDRELAGHIPAGVRPTAEQVADAVVFLMCQTAITGQILFVDGGQHLL